MAAAVMGDAAVSAGAQKHHLVFPGVRAQRPPVTEDHGLSRAPVLVVDLRAVFGSDRGHCLSPGLIGGVVDLSCPSAASARPGGSPAGPLWELNFDAAC